MGLCGGWFPHLRRHRVSRAFQEYTETCWPLPLRRRIPGPPAMARPQPPTNRPPALAQSPESRPLVTPRMTH